MLPRISIPNVRHKAAGRRSNKSNSLLECSAARQQPMNCVWTGDDEFSSLDDRRDEPPIPLPECLEKELLVVLVRHGQSTWNADGRMQGSSDFSVLTEKGLTQALATRDLV